MASLRTDQDEADAGGYQTSMACDGCGETVRALSTVPNEVRDGNWGMVIEVPESTGRSVHDRPESECDGINTLKRSVILEIALKCADQDKKGGAEGRTRRTRS
ncbi:hypothetical protein PHYBOEH_007371 [Phytophthora boehmeriae]|uniref:Uncharacterized protein n=1 Tax=Phytophthora boehmeriae TaxID=109152 RepID=A0A8T1WDN4_9STRA|nr:hypothetical protein PHYBOEH_007371 [Phytophthora boehmeriae]